MLHKEIFKNLARLNKPKIILQNGHLFVLIET